MKKMKILALTFMTFLSVGVVNVNAEEYGEVFKKITSDGTLEIKTIKPTNEREADFFIGNYLSSFDTEDYYFGFDNCNEDYSECLVVATSNVDSTQLESHTLKFTYATIDENIASEVNKVISKMPENKTYVVEDLEFINYVVVGGYNPSKFDIKVENAMVNYSSELRNYLGNGNITAKFDLRFGGGSPFSDGGGGALVFLRDDIIYGMMENVGAEKRYLIYVPDETEDSTEAYIAAAQKRINDYLKNDQVKITYTGKVSTDFDGELFDSIVDSSKRRDEYYTLTYNGVEFYLLIAKDSSKIKTEVVHQTNDVTTNISISTTSSTVPLDTMIKVNEITKNDIKYTEIIQTLKVETALVYDLKLYSSSKSDYISKLEDGTFKVSIPLPNEMKDKNLAAYYIKDDGTVEEHEVIVKDGYATFNTNHFSIYTIAEKKVEVGEEIPNTYDGVTSYITMTIISLVGLCFASLYLKNKKLS